MAWEAIPKPASFRVGPYLEDYQAVRARFSWAGARREFLGEPRAAGWNVADLAVDRHAEGPLAEKTALRWLARDGGRRDVSYRELRGLTNRFANVLRSLGVEKGERVFGLTGRIPEHHVAALGTLKNASVFCPVFSAFGPEPLAQRLGRGGAKVLVTTRRL